MDIATICWRKPLALLSLTTLIFAACGTTQEEDPLDPQDECALCNTKADAFGIVEGSPEALGVLELANTASFEVLDDDVRLHRYAATNIVAQRGSGFISLSALDAVPWVGTHAFHRLLEYAEANGYVDHGTTPCVDPSDDPRLAARPLVNCYREGSYHSLGIIAAASTLSLDILEYDVGLDVAIAKQIFYNRDRDGYSKLSVLALQPLADSAAFAKLSFYAQLHGLAPSCGDGELYKILEACDDGNTKSGDWCSDTCEVESTCGDGDVTGDYEQCDDGNEQSKDGCSETCQVETLEHPGGSTPELVGTYRRLGGQADINTSSLHTSNTWQLDLNQSTTLGIDYFGESTVWCYFSEHAGWDPTFAEITSASIEVELQNAQQQTIASTTITFSDFEGGVDLEQSLPPGRYFILIKGEDPCRSGHFSQPGYISYGMDLTTTQGTGPVCGDGVKDDDDEQCDDGNLENQDGCDSSCKIEALFEVEPNNDMESAQPIGTYKHVEGYIILGGDEDWLKLEISQAGIYNINVHCYRDTVIELYDEQGDLVAEDDDSGYERCSALNNQYLDEGVFTLRIRTYLPNMETEWELDIRQ